MYFQSAVFDMGRDQIYYIWNSSRFSSLLASITEVFPVTRYFNIINALSPSVCFISTFFPLQLPALAGINFEHDAV